MGSSGSSAQAQKGHLAVHSQARWGILTESQYLGEVKWGKEGGGGGNNSQCMFGQYSPVMVRTSRHRLHVHTNTIGYHCRPYCIHRQSAHVVSCSTVYAVIICQHSRHASLTTHHKRSLWCMQVLGQGMIMKSYLFHQKCLGIPLTIGCTISKCCM